MQHKILAQGDITSKEQYKPCNNAKAEKWLIDEKESFCLQ